MPDFLPGLGKAVPAIVMAAGCAPFFSAETPDAVKAGGACLLGVAMILVDLQSGKKFGYTDKIVGAIRAVPGFKDASEGEVLGLLTLGASAFLGGNTAAHMMGTGDIHPGWINQAYNYISYPLGAAFGIGRTQRYLESKLGSELSFTYRDADGEMRKTEPISTSRLLQQLAYLSGAAGVASFGVALDNAGIEFTGAMFALSNGLSIASLVKEPVKEVTAAKMEGLKRSLGKAIAESTGEPEDGKDAQAHAEALRKQWEEASKAYAEGKPVKTVEMQNLLRRVAAVITASVAEAWAQPAKQSSREV